MSANIDHLERPPLRLFERGSPFKVAINLAADILSTVVVAIFGGHRRSEPP
ncbi:MAG TPA: hypothetical protein VJ870_12350 [Amycolatopsis sp.]|nr:hypothetical protein [Amycolatopsis sp.]